MKIIEYFSCDNKENWHNQMIACDWGAGQWLGELLRDNDLQNKVGEGVLVPMLTDGDKLVSFCTLAPLDEIQPTELTPWIGFVYTFPEYRGHHYAGRIIDWAEWKATAMGMEAIHISTDHVGLYEKYGYDFFTTMKSIDDDECRIYRKILQEKTVDEKHRN